MCEGAFFFRCRPRGRVFFLLSLRGGAFFFLLSLRGGALFFLLSLRGPRFFFLLSSRGCVFFFAVVPGARFFFCCRPWGRVFFFCCRPWGARFFFFAVVAGARFFFGCRGGAAFYFLLSLREPGLTHSLASWVRATTTKNTTKSNYSKKKTRVPYRVALNPKLHAHKTGALHASVLTATPAEVSGERRRTQSLSGLEDIQSMKNPALP